MLSLKNALPETPRDIRLLDVPAGLRVLVLAPHPDDFDAIAVTLRHLHRGGAVLHLAVLTSGASGVEEGYQGAHDDDAKAALREIEQAASVAAFGLSPDQLEFVRLPCDTNGNPALDAANQARIRALLDQHRADIACMPHGNDSNVTHQRVYSLFKAAALLRSAPVTALLNQDAKTREMHPHLYMPFEEADAAWKGSLLRLHASQHSRNLNTRGHGFDARVLQVNQQIADGLKLPSPYAEVFEVETIQPQ